MIEILFAESEAASMKEVKAGEAICLGFMLDIGDIRESIDSSYRKELIYSMYAQNQWEQDEAIAAELREIGDLYAQELHRLQKFLDDGETIRIWYSDAPYSRCGLYHLCHLLMKRDNEIHVVKLPEYAVQKNIIISYQNWNEAAPEEFAGFLSYEKKLSKEEVRLYAAMWSDLMEDNSPLRAVVNGKVLSVPEDFYDFLIFRRLTDKPIKEARLLGDILGHSQISVGDWWYAKRIDHYIAQGKIRVVEDSKNKYARMISI